MSKSLPREEIVSIIRSNGGGHENILQILLALQRKSNSGYVEPDMISTVAEELGMTETKVYEVVTFYAMLKTLPKAKYVLKICNSSPCHFSKANEVVEILEHELGVKIGQDTEDGMFCYHYIPCVGACDIGPIIKLDDTVYGNLNETKIKNLIDDLRNGIK